jgi:hypothetical protein
MCLVVLLLEYHTLKIIIVFIGGVNLILVNINLVIQN